MAKLLTLFRSKRRASIEALPLSFLAIMVTLLNLACPGNVRAAEQTKSSDTAVVSAQLSRIAEELKASREAPDQGCRGLPSDRRSELCAQWVAADASKSASSSAFYSAIVAGLTLMAAVAATFFAWRSAAHTAAGLKEARRQLLPQIFLTNARIYLDSSMIVVRSMATNSGQTAAMNYWIEGSVNLHWGKDGKTVGERSIAFERRELGWLASGQINEFPVAILNFSEKLNDLKEFISQGWIKHMTFIVQGQIGWVDSVEGEFVNEYGIFGFCDPTQSREPINATTTQRPSGRRLIAA